MNDSLEQNTIFALDIGTHSVIGVVGYQSGNMFHVCGSERETHNKRVVVDGQIEDIAQTARTAGIVKDRLEKSLGITLKRVYVAAAGRALRTVETTAELAVAGASISGEMITKLEFSAVQKAHEQIAETDEQVFLCVGHVVRSYTLDGYPISSLLDHKGKLAEVNVIATFLPSEVVESLYATMRHIGLTVAGLTLEPIAAMNAIIPADLRKLNLALCDVGAGTSDIALCDGGTITGYTMATVAGDEITEAVMQACLVDFETAEQIKLQLSLTPDSVISYENILGTQAELSARELLETIKPAVENLAATISEKVLEVGGKAPSALFLVGGGSQTPLLRERVARGLGLDVNQVATGGSAHLKKMAEADPELYGPEYATPLGIALTAAIEAVADTFNATVNGEKLHLFQNWDTSVLGVLQMSGYRYRQIMERAGRNITYQLNGQRKIAYGAPATPSETTLNGLPATLSQAVFPGDVLTFQAAEPGTDAVLTLAEIAPTFFVTLDDEPLIAGQPATVNGSPANGDTLIQNGDSVEVQALLTLEQLLTDSKADWEQYELVVNGTPQEPSYCLHPADAVQLLPPIAHAPQQVAVPEPAAVPAIKHIVTPVTDAVEIPETQPAVPRVAEPAQEAPAKAPIAPPVTEPVVTHVAKGVAAVVAAEPASASIHAPSTQPTPKEPPVDAAAPQSPVQRAVHRALQRVAQANELSKKEQSERSLHVYLNGKPLDLPPKEDDTPYQFFDLLAFADIDPRRPQGEIVQTLNGTSASYLATIKDADRAEIYWNDAHAEER